MTRTLGNDDHPVALSGIGPGDPEDPPSSAWGVVAAPADEDDGFGDDLFPLPDDDWPGEWGAAGMGVP